MVHPLSSRVRPSVEAAPWVVEEIKQLESQKAAMLAQLKNALRYIEVMTAEASTNTKLLPGDLDELINGKRFPTSIAIHRHGAYFSFADAREIIKKTDAGSAKLLWADYGASQDDGEFASFHGRAWPCAVFADGPNQGLPAVRLSCQDPYDEVRAANGNHGPITISVAFYSPRGKSLWLNLLAKGHNLSEAKTIADDYWQRNCYKHTVLGAGD